MTRGPALKPCLRASDPHPVVAPGSTIKLRLSFLEHSIPVEIPAQVIRESETGFAVEFKKLNSRTRREDPSTDFLASHAVGLATLQAPLRRAQRRPKA